MRCRTVAAELFYLRHLRSCAMTAYGSNSTGHTCHGRAVGESWLAFLGLENPFNALLQRILVLRLCAQAVSRSVLWLLYYIFKYTTFAMIYLLQNGLALLHIILELEYSPLELAACGNIINASVRTTCSFTIGGGTSELATILLSLLCLILAMADWHVPQFVMCRMLICRSLSALCMQCLDADYALIAMAFLFPTFGKRSNEQETDGCNKRSASERSRREPAAEPVDATLLDSDGYAITEHEAPNAIDRYTDAAASSSITTAYDEQSMRANLDDILVRLQSSNHENVLGIRRAAETLQRGSQQDIRALRTMGCQEIRKSQ